MAKEAAKKKEEAKEDDKEKDDKKGKKDEKSEGGDAKEGEGAEGGEGEAAGGKSKKKFIIIGVVALVVLLGGGAGLYFSGVLGGGSEEEHAAEGEEGAVGEDGKPISKPVYYTLPEFLINLTATGKQSSFLKTTVILELAKEGDTQAVEGTLPKLQDAFNTYLRELRASDLAGSAGIQRLREELLLRANKALAPVKVNDVLFKEIVVQ